MSTYCAQYPISWDTDTETYYDLGAIIMCRTVNAFDDEFPLRMIPKGDPDLIEFQGFVDKLGDAVTMTQDEAVEHTKKGSNSQEDEWSIKAIIGTKTKKKRKHYIILWDSNEVTLEPKDML